MHISKEGNHTCLNILMSMTNGGLVSSAQDTQITLHSLTNITNLPTIFNQYEEWDDFELAFMPTSDYAGKRESIAMDIRKSVHRLTINRYNREPEQDKQTFPEIPELPEHSTDQILKLQNPLECSNIVTVLERESVMNRMSPAEESKVEEDLLAMISSTIKPEQPPVIVEQDLFALLEKVRKEIVTIECIDKKFVQRPLANEELSATISEADNDILNGKTWKKDPSNGLRFTDEDFLNAQKKVLGHFLRSMGKNFLEGKSIMNVSLPVTIFSRESMLQRAASSLAYAPTLLPIAGQQTSPLEAFKYVTAFYFSTLHTAIAQSKPFNPILGK